MYYIQAITCAFVCQSLSIFLKLHFDHLIFNSRICDLQEILFILSMHGIQIDLASVGLWHVMVSVTL